MLLSIMLSLLIESPSKIYAIVDPPPSPRSEHFRQVIQITWPLAQDPQVEVIAEVPRRFLSENSKHGIVGNWLVTSSGGVLDLATKQIIHDESDGKLLGVTGNKVYFRLDNINRPQGVFEFDGNTRKVLAVAPTSSWNLPGIISPNQTQSVTSKTDGSIWLNRIGENPRLLTGNCTAQVSPFSSYRPIPPVMWLTDQLLLTQERNGELITVDIGGKRTKLVSIPALPKEIIFSPQLSKNQQGKIIYECGDQEFEISLEKCRATRLLWIDLGNEFEISHQKDAVGLRVIRFQGKPIARRRCDFQSIGTSKIMIALIEETEPQVEPKLRLLWIWQGHDRKNKVLHLPVRSLLSLMPN